MHPRSLSSSLAFVAVTALLMQMLAIGAGAATTPNPLVAPGNAPFQRTWARTDQPVLFGSVARTWMWGPDANTPVMQEDYLESPGGKRDVQYFDKSRMEITHPDAVDDGVWYVTNGLLVVEMMTGQLQVGDNSFIPRAPAMVNVAGDADDPLGPTYTTFAGLRDQPPLADGVTITQRVNRAGVISNDPALATHGVTAGHRVTVPGIDHQIATPFWEFMNSSGLVHEHGQDGQALLFQNPYYATGYPLTEAYWANVKIANTYRDVLMQCFERRCLTYTPGNSPGFVTEAGNVGQHYYTWRYEQADDAAIVINEVMYWPEDGDMAWVELYNRAGDAVDLSGWTLSNGLGSTVAGLPSWQIPGGSYLVVRFGAGAHDADFADGAGTYYTGPAGATFFSTADVALYAGQPGVDTIVDFVGWSYNDTLVSGPAYAHAVAAGIWPAGAVFDAASGGTLDEVDGPPHPLLATVSQGMSIGRDKDSTDTNTPADWAGAGGYDADGDTPGARNLAEGLVEGAAAFDTPIAKQVTPPLAKKKWTVLVYFDARDANIAPHWRRERRAMQQAGSDGDVNIVTQYMANTYAERHYITNGGMQSFAMDAVDPGDPASLSAFITWAKTNFPADKYAIVIAGHGNGWKGVLINRSNQDFLTMSELSTGLGALGQKFETVFFYACLMGMVEVGHQIEGQAKYMTASQQVMWTGFPWKAWLDGLKANPDQTGGTLADSVAQRIAADYDAIISAPASDPPNPAAEAEKQMLSAYTIASTTLATITGTLSPAVAPFGAALRADVEEYAVQDKFDDNWQILIKHGALEPAKKMRDGNFLDLYHFAQLVQTLPISAAALAQPVRDGVDAAVRWESHGPGAAHANQHGLTIYFPRTLLLPSDLGACSQTGCARQYAYSQPLYDPLVPAGKKVTHLYKKDPDILVPKLALVEHHPMRDDPGFLFPIATSWHTFLHRYYKPVADACIRWGGGCHDAVAVQVGETVLLSGHGSSDSDGPEGPMDDVPPERHFYWDFYTSVDHAAPKPKYLEHVHYIGCGQPTVPPIDTDADDCDRNDIDTADDDVDATGKLVPFTCDQVGIYPIRLMVWDEHHDQVRQSHEEQNPHNLGRHWLHFNIDDDWVLVVCGDPTEPRKPIKRATVSVEPGDVVEYQIAIIGNEELNEPAPASMTDPLPEAFFTGIGLPDVEVQCTSGTCSFDTASLAVVWNGELSADDVVAISFQVHVPVEGPPLPPQIVNCATVFDGVMATEVCATTEVELDDGPSTSTPGYRNKGLAAGLTAA